MDLNLGSAVKAMCRAHTERTHRVLCPWWLTSEEARSTCQSSSHSFSLFSSKSCGAMHLWGCWSYRCLVPEWADCLCVLNYRRHWESGSVSLRERDLQPQKEGFFWKGTVHFRPRTVVSQGVSSPGVSLYSTDGNHVISLYLFLGFETWVFPSCFSEV